MWHIHFAMTAPTNTKRYAIALKKAYGNINEKVILSRVLSLDKLKKAFLQ